MQYCRDDSESFKFKSRFTNNTGDAVTVNVELAGLLKYLSNFGELLKCLESIVKLVGSNLVCKLLYLSSRWNNNICNNWYKTLCSSSNFVNSRQCKAASTVSIKSTNASEKINT